MVVAQLVELLTLELSGLNQVIGNFDLIHFVMETSRKRGQKWVILMSQCVYLYCVRFDYKIKRHCERISLNPDGSITAAVRDIIVMPLSQLKP